MTASLRDASVVVIGGSSGIGLVTAKMAHEAGARLTIAGRDADRLADARDEIGEDVRTVALDIADEAAVKALFDSLDTVDHVASLAGTFAFGLLAETETSALQGPVDSRFWGPVYVTKHAAPRMTSGSLTFCTGSGIDRPSPGTAVFSAAAGGAEVFSRAMALELAPIRVNVVRPGAVDTPLFARASGDSDQAREGRAATIPLHRIGQADEIAHAILFLMTNEYITGASLPVDGGASLK